MRNDPAQQTFWLAGRFRRMTIRWPGWDDHYAQCRHSPSGDHGIHGEEIAHVVMHELADGRRVAFVLQVFTDEVPVTVPPGWPRRAPRTVGLELHVQDTAGKACELLGVPCVVTWDSALASDAYEMPLLGVSTRRALDVPHTQELLELVRNPSAQFWEALEAGFAEKLADPDLFPQADETDVMADVRTRREQALAAYTSAGDALVKANAEWDAAVKKYGANDPAYRRR